MFARAESSMKRDNLLMVADSEHDANMLYAVRMFVPDSFIYLRINGKCHIVMNDLEIDRARKQPRLCREHSCTHYINKLTRNRAKCPGFHTVSREILPENQLRNE